MKKKKKKQGKQSTSENMEGGYRYFSFKIPINEYSVGKFLWLAKRKYSMDSECFL